MTLRRLPEALLEPAATLRPSTTLAFPTHTLILSVFALLASCTKEPSNGALTKATPSNSPIHSRAKAIILEKLTAYQSKAEGLYALSDGRLRVGVHSVDLTPVVESEGSREGKSIVAMRIEVAIDGVPKPKATFGVIGIAGTQEEAIVEALGEWYLALALPLFQSLAAKKPSLVIADYDVFAGTLGVRGNSGWVDGKDTDAMHRKILDSLLPGVPRPADFVILDLKVMVPPAGQPQSECRIDGAVSTTAASRLIGLDWPRTADGYLFKQVFVLKRRNSN